jgi:hypothetical protein
MVKVPTIKKMSVILKTFYNWIITEVLRITENVITTLV